MRTLGNHGVARARRLVWGAGVVLAWACGCSQSELARKDDEIKLLTQRWQQCETARATLWVEKTRLGETLKARESALASLTRAYETAGKELAQRTDEVAASAAALKRVEEKSYDLEMSYETLNERINELAHDIEERNGRIAGLKQATADLEEKMRVGAEEAARTLADQTAKTESARAETGRMRSLAESLDAEGKKLKSKNAQLEREAAQIPELKAQIAALTGAKGNLEAQLVDADKNVELFQRQAAGIKAAAEAAGTAIPVGMTGFSDWEVLKRMAANRWDRARKGSFTGDPVDWVIAGVAGVTLLVLALWAGAIARVLRRGRRITSRAAAENPAPVADESLDAEPMEDDLALPDAPPADGQEYVPEECLDVAGEEEAAAESVLAFEGAQAPEIDGDDAAMRGDPVPAAERAAPAKGTQPARQIKDEAMIGELRDVINKKFDELLKG